MVERILEIVIFLVRRIQAEGGKLDRLETAATDLQGLGFTNREISSAYGWLLATIVGTGDQAVRLVSGSIRPMLRVLSDRERGAITPEGQGELFSLLALGILDDDTLEALIERVVIEGHAPVDAEEVRRVAAMILFGGDLPPTMDVTRTLLADEEPPVH
jgi:uncharacterized protein Smg (DUF494 family)